MAHVPTASQLSKLASLQTTYNAAQVSFNANVAATQTAQAAMLAAAHNLKNYETYIYGGLKKPGIIDEGGPDIA